MSKKNPATLKTPIWSLKAAELLEGDDWMDGLEFFRTVAKAIPPGVATRKAEIIRASAARRRHGKEVERSQPITTSAAVAAGRRAIVQSMVSSRQRKEAWEVDPWPLPRDAWHKGGWRIRNGRRGLMSFTDTRLTLQTTGPVLRELLAQDPPIPVVWTGDRNSAIATSHLPELRERLRALWERRARAKMAAGMELPNDMPWYPFTELERRYGMAITTIHDFHAANPDVVRVIRTGRINRIMAEDLRAWEKAMLEYMVGEHGRRAAANRRKVAADSPMFQDPQLAASAEAFLSGQAGPEQMHEDMRRVFQDLEAADEEDVESDSEDDEEWDAVALESLVDDPTDA